jgi:membrane protein YqaA with SNARE-associated domain
MLATIAGIGILAWWIGFFDPETCVPEAQQAGWTSCETIARERTIALWVLVSVTVLGAVITLIRRPKKKR